MKYSQGPGQLTTAETRSLCTVTAGPDTCLAENRHQVTAWTRRTKKSSQSGAVTGTWWWGGQPALEAQMLCPQHCEGTQQP